MHLSMILLSLAVAFPQDDKKPKGPLHGLEYRSIGPSIGGRVSRAVGVPGEPLTYYAATAAGGVWKSTNGGQTFKSVFDKQPVSSIGSIAVAPSDPNVVWVGSGEANIRGNVGEGNGIYHSTDAGKNWKHVFKAEGQIGTILVHPKDPDTVWAAALGSPFGPTDERGIYRTTDGGKTWKRVLFVDRDTGASDVCCDPSNPRILFAGMWQTRRTPWSMTSGGPGGGLWTSRDSGETWKRLEGKGLPDGIWGRVGVRVAATDANRVYALIEAKKGGLFRSDDGGKKWKRINGSRGLTQRAWYYSTLTIDPARADVVWFPQVKMLRTNDGGDRVRTIDAGGWDYHDVWIDPADQKRMIVASDGGVSVTRDGGKTWHRAPLPIGQFYHVSVDTRRPYRVLGTLQDFGTVSGPSNSLHGNGILATDWHPVGGGEAGHVVADPDNPDIVWAGEYLGIITRFDGRLRLKSNVSVYPYDGSGHGAKDLRYRFQWTAPIVISPHDAKTVYHAGNVLFRTRDRGQNWDAISPDLTRNDVTKQQWAGGPITGDNTGVEYYGTIFAVAESRVAKGQIWVGTDDGLVQLTRDGGKSWKNVTPTGAPHWGTVVCIEASRRDPSTAYVVYDAHRLDDEKPYLWKTTDHGESWTSLTKGLDSETYLHVVREDTRVKGMLYLGTERSVMVSRDDGSSWESLRLNMPTVAVVDLVVAGDDLVVGTLGRSAWILDDLTVVREQPKAYAGATAHLFAPRATTAWRYGAAPRGPTDGKGANPPKGAIITYRLAAATKDEITLTVRDNRGDLVRKLSSTAEDPYAAPDHPDRNPKQEDKPALKRKAGINRAAWNLRYAGPRRIKGAKLDYGNPGEGPLVAPGTYALELKIGEATFRQSLRVESDPRLGSSEHRAVQLAFALDASNKFTKVTDHVVAIRSVREQIQTRNRALASNKAATQLIAQGVALIEGLDAVEAILHNPKAEVSYDVLAGRSGGAQLHSQLEWLFMIAREHEGPPTQGMRERATALTRELRAQEAKLDSLLEPDLDALNALAKQLGIAHVIR